eukprot:5623660-Prorocentrum_lima.AAC.1
MELEPDAVLDEVLLAGQGVRVFFQEKEEGKGPWMQAAFCTSQVSKLQFSASAVSTQKIAEVLRAEAAQTTRRLGQRPSEA